MVNNMTTQLTKIEISDLSALKVLKNFFVAVTLLAITGTSQAATFSDPLSSTTSDPNLYYLNPNPGYSAEFTGTGLIMSSVAGSHDALNYVGNNNLTFTGNYQHSVVISDLRTGTPGYGAAGLTVFPSNGTPIDADIYGFNNACCGSTNLIGATVTDTQIGINQDLLTISGNTSVYKYTFSLFLGQVYNPATASNNSVTFTNLNITADNISGVVSTPIPSAIWLVGTGLLGIFRFIKRESIR